MLNAYKTDSSKMATKREVRFGYFKLKHRLAKKSTSSYPESRFKCFVPKRGLYP